MLTSAASPRHRSQCYLDPEGLSPQALTTACATFSSDYHILARFHRYSFLIMNSPLPLRSPSQRNKRNGIKMTQSDNE